MKSAWQSRKFHFAQIMSTKTKVKLLSNPLKLKEDLLLDIDKKEELSKGMVKTRLSGKTDMIL